MGTQSGEFPKPWWHSEIPLLRSVLLMADTGIERVVN